MLKDVFIEFRLGDLYPILHYDPFHIEDRGIKNVEDQKGSGHEVYDSSREYFCPQDQ